MGRNRDRERFIGPHDPAHELPDPDRRPGDRTDHDRFYGSDRGWDAERERHRDRDRERAQYEDYFGSRERDRDGRRR